MKSLTNYISEAIKSTGKPEVDKQLKELEELASKKNLTIKFRNKKMNTGDFCIFIYSPKQRRYEVGFDGDWNGSSEFNFESCYTSAKEWIEKYKG